MHPYSFARSIVDGERKSESNELLYIHTLVQFVFRKSIADPFASPTLTQARIIHQSSAVLRLNIPNRLINLAATKMVANTKVVVVTIKTVLLREWVVDRGHWD